MPVVHPISLEGTALPEPGILILGTLGLVAPVLGPLDLRVLAQDTRLDERPDIHSHAVIEVRVPADGLFGEGLPADEDVVPIIDNPLTEFFLLRVPDGYCTLED